MGSERSQALDAVHPQMLRMKSEGDPQELGMASRKRLGQCLEWALDRARITNQDAAFRMGYSDSGVVSRWINGTERQQLDKLKLLGEVFWQEYVIALAQDCPGVEVKTQITLARVSA